MAQTDLYTARGDLVGRLSAPEIGPQIVVLRDGEDYDITSRDISTIQCLFELPVPSVYAATISGNASANLANLGTVGLSANGRLTKSHLPALNDLHSIKAAADTFARSKPGCIFPEDVIE